MGVSLPFQGNLPGPHEALGVNPFNARLPLNSAHFYSGFIFLFLVLDILSSRSHFDNKQTNIHRFVASILLNQRLSLIICYRLTIFVHYLPDAIIIDWHHTLR